MILPFQGVILCLTYTQGVALGCEILPFQGASVIDEASLSGRHFMSDIYPGRCPGL